MNVCLVQEELEKNPIDLSDQELQRAMDGFRRVRKLYKAEDTYSWMERRGITHQQLEQLACSQAKLAKLRDRLVASRVQDYFDGHSADFDTAYSHPAPPYAAIKHIFSDGILAFQRP